MKTKPPGVNSKLFTDEFDRRGWTYKFIGDTSFLVIFPDSGDPFIMHGTLSEINSATGYEIAENKDLLYGLAEMLKIPVPKTIVYSTAEQALLFLESYKKVVVKPADTDHGIGVFVGITDADELQRAIQTVQRLSERVIIQQFCNGNDYRFLVVGEEVLAVVNRVPAFIVGDGIRTVEELVVAKNISIKQILDGMSRLEISLSETEEFIGPERFKSIPELDETVQLIGAANVSRGGESVDCTAEVHEELKQFAVSVAKLLRLEVAGIDILIDDIHMPLSSAGAVLIEANKMPGLRMHDLQADGTTINATAKIVDQMVLHRKRELL